MTDIWYLSTLLLDIVLILTIPFVIVFILLENRNPIKTVSWILVIIFIPVIGLIFYFMLGRNYRKRKLFSRKGLKDFQHIEIYSSKQILSLSNDSNDYSEKVQSKLGIVKLLLNNNKALLTEYNEVKVLNNGEETFNSICEELQKATNHIHIEYYIIEAGEVGNRVCDILIAKSLQGVKVRLIYDSFGSWNFSTEFQKKMSAAGIEIFEFMPVRFPWLTTRINFRNHRKIIVIDGVSAFVGGLNIADRYMSRNEEIGFWRDTHLRIQGDAAKSLQIVFLTDWYFVSNQLIDAQNYFPEIPICNKCLVQIASSGPDSDWASIMQSYFYAISTAKDYVYISTPYLFPNESILTALKTTALSGVDVRIILPKKTDSALMHWGAMSYIEELLESGIKIYMYKKGFTHSKLMICDDVFASVGTANLDIRSFDQNFEVSALIYDETLTKELKCSYLDDLSYCEQTVLEEFTQRSTQNKIKEALARIFSPLL